MQCEISAAEIVGSHLQCTRALQSLQAKLCQAVQHQLPGLCRWLTLGADVQRAHVLGGLRPGCRCLLRSFVPG